MDLRHDKTETFLGRKVTGISLHSGDVMALAGDSLLMVDIKGRRLAGVRLAQPAQGCFYDEANAMNYLVSDGHVQLFRDKEIGKPEAWQQMEVGMSVPMNCHNVILANPRQHQSLLVGKYSLFRVANHQDVFNSIGEVELACTSGNNIYYLVGTRLFRQAVGKDEAVQIKDISGGTGDVRFMQVIGNRLYYVDSANKAYSARLYSSYLLNSLLSFDRLVSPAVRHEVTAMGADGANVYLGIRDGLVNLHRADSCLDSNVFINRFVCGRDRVAFATLNDGVFTGRDNRFRRVAGTERLAFVRDVAFVPSDSSHTALYILTNHALLRSHADSLTMMCPATGYRRLLAADSKRIYGVADFGIDNLTDSVRLFSDVHFEPEACLVADGKVYAGSGSGVYVFGGTEGKQEAAESGYTVVRFVAKTLFSRTNIVLLVVLYEVADNSQDAQLLDMIGLARKKGDGLFLGEKLLLIMMAQSKHKISAFSTMACASEQHIRKLRREIIGKGMKPCIEKLKKYAEENPTSFAPLLLGAYEFYILDETQKYKAKDKREAIDN